MVFEFLKRQKQTEFPKKRLEVPTPPPFKEALPSLKDVREAKIELPSELEFPSTAEFEHMAVEEEREELKKREHLEPTKPIFINVNTFRGILEELNAARNSLKEGQDAVLRISDLKENQDGEFKKWQSTLQDIQKKLIYIDKTLFG